MLFMRNIAVRKSLFIVNLKINFRYNFILANCYQIMSISNKLAIDQLDLNGKRVLIRFEFETSVL